MSGTTNLEIKSALESRGVYLRRPAQAESITRLKEAFPALEESFFDVFQQFDGFESGQLDGSSAIAIWEIDKIISVAHSSNANRSERIAFGDVMMDSEHICCSPSNLEKPVFLDESGEPLAASYFDFWTKLCSGDLDFS